MSPDINRGRSSIKPKSGAGGGRSDNRLLRVYLRELGTISYLDRETEVRYAVELQESREAFAVLVQELPSAFREVVINGDASGPQKGRKWPLQRLDECYDRLISCLSQPDDPETRQALGDARRHKRRIDHSRDALILANLPLVTDLARRASNSGSLPFMDLIQEGSIGLMEAIDRFEPDRGHRLATYAQWWIRRAISAALRGKSRMIRIPENMIGRVNELRSVTRELSIALGREPTPQEVAGEMQLPVHKVSRLLAVVRDPQPLESFGTEKDGVSAIQQVADGSSADPLSSTIDRESKQWIGEALNLLKPQEEKVIRLRFGLDGSSRRTLREIGVMLSLSPERVRQIEHNALGKLNKAQKPKISRSSRVRRGERSVPVRPRGAGLDT